MFTINYFLVLLRRLDESCDAIVIQSNVYFVHLLLDHYHHGKYHRYLSNKVFPRPFHNIAMVVFKPIHKIMDRVEAVKKHLSSGNSSKWLSVHARGMMMEDGDTSFYHTMACANYLLDRGIVDFVFFATDDEPLQHRAKHILEEVGNGNKFLSIPKDLVKYKNLDTFQIRNTLDDMETAVLEWLVEPIN